MAIFDAAPVSEAELQAHVDRYKPAPVWAPLLVGFVVAWLLAFPLAFGLTLWAWGGPPPACEPADLRFVRVVAR